MEVPNPDAGPESSQSKALDTTQLAVAGSVGPYRLTQQLGAGGMGIVYKAVHSELEKTVAVKLLSIDRQDDSGSRERFKRETRVVGKLDHQHIVKATDAGEEDGLYFLVMEYVEGIDLSRLVKRSGPLPVADACEVGRQVLSGLQHAYQNGIVHRDIKPSNVMLSNSGIVKILDMGLARLWDEDAYYESLTSTGQVLGTADYLAPEQSSDAHNVDIRADIYSLGCTLFHLLAGSPPFGSSKYSTFVAKMLAHESEPIPSIRKLREDVPWQLAKILDRMLAKRPDQRYATPAEAAAALQPFCQEHDLGALLEEVGIAAHVQDAQELSRTTEGPISSPLTDTRVSSDNRRTSGVLSAQKEVDAQGGRFTNRRHRIFLAAGLVGAIVLFALMVFHLSAEKGQHTVADYDPILEALVEKNDAADPESKTKPAADGKSDGIMNDSQRVAIEQVEALGGIWSHDGESLELVIDPMRGNSQEVVRLAHQIPTLRVVHYPLVPDLRILEYLAEIQGLHRLSLGGTAIFPVQVDDDWVFRIASIRVRDSLVLDGARLPSDGVALLSLPKSLKSLSVVNTGIDDDHVRSLVGLRNLEALRAADNPVTDASIEPILTLEHLTDLDLGNTSLTVSGVMQLISNEGFRARIRHLGISGLREINDSLLQALVLCESLETLKINNAVLEQCNIHILAECRTLNALELYDTDLRSEQVDRLRILLPRCEILWSKSNSSKQNLFHRVMDPAYCNLGTGLNGRGELSISGEVIRCSTTQTADKIWGVQLGFPAVGLRNGRKYRLIFDGRADQNRRQGIYGNARPLALADQQKGHFNGLNQSIDLTVDWQHYEVSFRASGIDQDDVNLLNFQLGSRLGTIEIRNPMLREVPE